MSKEQGFGHQQDAASGTHDQSVVKGIAYGHKTVKSHHCQQENIQSNEPQEEIDLRQASSVRDGMPVSLDVH